MKTDIESAVETAAPDTRPLHVQWSEISNAPVPNDREQREEYFKRREEVGRAFYASQQIPEAPQDAIHLQHVIARERTTKGSQRRGERIAVLVAFLARPAVPPVIADPAVNVHALAPKARLLATPGIYWQIEQAKRLLAEHELFALQNYAHAYPEARAEEIEHELQSAAMEQFPALKAEHALLKSSGKAAELAAKTHIRRSLEPALAAMADLITACSCCLQTWEADAIAMESAFLSDHGLPHEATAVSKRYADAKKHLPTPSVSALTWFGVEDVTA